jgi:hypothetical protein
MGRQKKPSKTQSTDALEVKRLREGLNREAQALRTRAGSLAVARDELAATGSNDFTDAVAFLSGQVRAYYGAAANLDDLRCGNDVPF